MVDFEMEILPKNPENIELLVKAKEKGFTDEQIAVFWNMTEEDVREIREKAGIKSCFKMVDTCAGEFETATPYYYSGWNKTEKLIKSDRKKVVVLGSGPIRIGRELSLIIVVYILPGL